MLCNWVIFTIIVAIYFLLLSFKVLVARLCETYRFIKVFDMNWQ